MTMLQGDVGERLDIEMGLSNEDAQNTKNDRKR